LNLETEKAYKRNYYWTHRDELLAKQRIRQRQSRIEEPERHRGYHDKWKANHFEQNTEIYRNWQNANRQKVRAKIMAERYVPLKSACEKCGATEKLERHHFDYSKPLEVLTLCKRCHEASPKAICSEPDKPEFRYLMGWYKCLIIERGNIANCSNKRLWRIRRLDTGETLDVYPAKLAVFPYPHGFRKDRRPKDWSPLCLDDKPKIKM